MTDKTPVNSPVTTSISTVPNDRQAETKKHIRGSSLLLGGRLISLGLNFGVQILTVRYLSKSDYGAFAYALSVVSIGASVTLFGLDKAIARFVPIYEEQQDYSKMFGTILMSIGVILGLGLALVSLIFGLQGLLLQHFISNPLSLALLLILITLSPLQALDNWFQGIFAVFADPSAIFFRRHILGPGLKLTAVLLVVLVQGNAYLLAFGYLIGGLIGVGAYIALLVRLWADQNFIQYFDLKSIRLPVREVFSFSVPLLTSDVVVILRTSMVVVLLEYFRGTTDVAAFRAVLPVAGLNLVAMQSFKYLFTPLAARLFARNDRTGINNLYWQTAIWVALISFPVFIVSFSLAQPLTLFLFGPRYAESGIILALLSLGNYFNAALGFNSYTLRVYGKVRYIFFIDVLAASISVMLSLLLIPQYGALGAAVGACGTLIIHNIFNHIGLRLNTEIRLFHWQYLRVYFSIVLGAVGLLLTHWIASPPIYVSLFLSGIVSLVVIFVNRTMLNVEDTFPELLRIPLMRQLLAQK